MPQSVGGITPNNMVQVMRQEEMQADFYPPDPRHGENWRIDEEAFSPYWPGRGSMLGEAEPLLVAPPDHTARTGDFGGNGTQGFAGITRDGNNTPVGGMTVRLFRTSDSLLVASVVSRADGSYNISTPYTGVDHFITAHKSGSPEVAGASQSTLQPW